MKKISILGDSISTYEGYNPNGYSVYYEGYKKQESGLTSVKDTWWWQVIEGLNGKLEVNDSFSGSLASGNYPFSANNKTRCQNLGEPDCIFIFMGFNDRGYKIPLGEEEKENADKFFGGYLLTLDRIKEKYGDCKVYCISLLDAHIIGGENYPISEKFIEETRAYNRVIERVAKEKGCIYLDIFSFKKSYESLDFCHPTAVGHKQIAEMILKRLSSVNQ